MKNYHNEYDNNIVKNQGNGVLASDMPQAAVLQCDDRCTGATDAGLLPYPRGLEDLVVVLRPQNSLYILTYKCVYICIYIYI